MSTTFAIFKKRPKTDGHGQLTDEDRDIDHTVIAYRSRDIVIISALEPIISHLDDDVEVYPLDNGPQGIYTIGDIRKEINNGK